MYKAILNILPTWERLARIGQNNSNLCPHCPEKVEEVWHIISQCQSKDATVYLLQLTQKLQTDSCIPDLLYLQWRHTELSLPLSWLVTMGIDIIWANRLSGGIKPFALYAEFKARLSILLQTKFHKEAKVVESALLSTLC